MPSPSTIHERPLELLQNLVRFDTTNPPGNETACIAYIGGLLKDAGIKTTILAKEKNRPNLIARLKGRGQAPPLLLYGHVDVVTTANQQWTHPPFAAEIHDGYVWGRGTLDMKSGVAMYVAAMLRAKLGGLDLPGDVVLAILADEEAAGIFGAKYLVEEHPEQFEGIRYALGEFGGFSFPVSGRTFYPIMVAEKQVCWMRLTLRGPGGHGSMPLRGGAMAHLGQILRKLDQSWLPVHVTPSVRMMVEGLAGGLSFPASAVMRGLLNPALTGRVLGTLGDRARLFAPLFHNTVSPTIVHGGHKINVIPSEISLDLDGRLLPGFQPEDMLRELRGLLGDVDLEVLEHDPGPADPDMGLFDMLGSVLKESDPRGVPIPYVISGVTDARLFSLLGIQTYGFTPMQIPSDLNFASTIHAADERVPVGALDFGTDAVVRALQRFGEGGR